MGFIEHVCVRVRCGIPVVDLKVAMAVSVCRKLPGCLRIGGSRKVGRAQGAAAQHRSSSVDLVPTLTVPAADTCGKDRERSLEGGEEKEREKVITHSSLRFNKSKCVGLSSTKSTH